MNSKSTIVSNMEFFGFVSILSESLKIISKTRKAIAIIAAITITIRSSLYLIVVFSTKQAIKNLFGQQLINLYASVGTPAFPSLLVETKRDFLSILAAEWVIILVSAAVTLFSVGSMSLVSASAYCGKSLSFQTLIPKLANSFGKQVVTSFHTTVFEIGYIFCFLVTLLPPAVLIFFDHPTQLKAFSYTILGVGLISITYLSIVWTLAMVITMIEEKCFGMEALGKAAGLIKGNKIQAFAVILVLVPGNVIILVYAFNRTETPVSMEVFVGMLMLCFNFMVSVLLYVSYTVLYFQFKKSHGEEMELQGEWEYSKVALITQDFPREF